MICCEQTKGQNVYQHGLKVWNKYQQIISYLKNKITLDSSWRLPEWLNPELLENLYNEEIISLYTIYHDCGKPYCLEIDSKGQRHFPNHATVSKKVFEEIFSHPHKETIKNLIGWDMVIHIATAKEIDEYLKIWSKKDAVTLLVAALAEVHANAAMFGGTNSISFKSKWKKINRRGKQILKGIKNV